MQEDKILEYLKLKISNFENKQQMGKMFFTCPNHQKHRFGRRPSATFRGESQRVVCAVCKFDGNIYDIVKTLEPSLSGLSDSEIDNHIIETISPNKLKILDIYEKNNWALIPVKENAKNPLEKGWTDSEHRDKSKWVGWLNKGYNIGINCGKSNIIVIDIDNKAFSQDVTPIREKIISLVKTANTLVQKTANGGEHYIFLADNDIPQFTDLLGTKIDSRTDGGQILVEPSKLEGKEYKWENINSEIKPISEELKKELLELCKKPVSTEIKQECFPAPTTDYSLTGNVVKIVKEGEGRNSLLTSIGGDLINKLEPDKTAYVLNVINNRFFNPPLAEHELNGMLTSLSGYKFSEEELQQRAVLDYMLMLNSETTVKDIMEVTRLPRRNVELVLTKLVKENKVNTFGRGRYRIKDKINWTDEIPTVITEWKYKMPFFNDVANFESTELLYLAAKTNDGKTSICMNILKQIIEQGLKPYYLYSETASRWNKIADKLGIAGKFYHCFHSNPMAIELEKNAFTIIDWLMIEHKEETDVVLKHLNDELRSKGGILIVMGQLKTNYDYFAPNLVDQFPTFAAKYIQDNQEKTHGHWELTKVKEPKLNNFIPNVECTYDFNTRLFIAKPVI